MIRLECSLDWLKATNTSEMITWLDTVVGGKNWTFYKFTTGSKESDYYRVCLYFEFVNEADATVFKLKYGVQS